MAPSSASGNWLKAIALTFLKIADDYADPWDKLAPGSQRAIAAHLFAGGECEDFDEIAALVARYRGDPAEVLAFFGWVPELGRPLTFVQPELCPIARKRVSLSDPNWSGRVAFELHCKLFEVVKR